MNSLLPEEEAWGFDDHLVIPERVKAFSGPMYFVPMEIFPLSECTVPDGVFRCVYIAKNEKDE